MRRRLFGAGAALGVAVALTALFIRDPAQSGWFPPCPVHAVTGLACPGCGSLRAVHRLLHGHVMEAMAMNPLMVLSIPVLLAFVLRPSLARHPAVPKAVLVVVLLYTLLRNIPVHPFTLLAPG